ncbi:MAG: hypothetical protein OER04_14125 [Cyclobacteriaceae bacterium]|nr:hypothetical protein [Cyclobacteriaceae bacterium]
METSTNFILYLHIAAGSISLVLFWLPVINKKGGKAHSNIGKAYVMAMWIVVFTALALSIKNLFIQNYIAAAFLGFLSVLTSAPLWYAKAILNHKKEISRSYFNRFKALHTVIFFMATGLVIWSVLLKVQDNAILLLIFGILGMTSFGDAFSNYHKIRARETWIVTHLRGMLSTGIAAYTAFFAFGGRQFLGNILTDQWMVIPWVLPSIIGVLGIRYWTKKFTKRQVATA